MGTLLPQTGSKIVSVTTLHTGKRKAGFRKMKRNKWIAVLVAAALVLALGSLAIEAKGPGSGTGTAGFGRQGQATIEQKQAMVQSFVAKGKLTNEQALQVNAQLQSCDGTCDGTGPSEDQARIGQEYGLALGNQGAGLGTGTGRMARGGRFGGNNGVCPNLGAND